MPQRIVDVSGGRNRPLEQPAGLVGAIQSQRDVTELPQCNGQFPPRTCLLADLIGRNNVGLDLRHDGTQGGLVGLYCARGDMENRIKEQQLGLFADRASGAALRVNQFRLYFASFAWPS